MDPRELSPVTIGRIVHYVMEGGVERPAIIVQVWNSETGTSNLQVFTDSGNDGLTNVVLRTSIPRSMKKEANTWHWPETSF